MMHLYSCGSVYGAMPTPPLQWILGKDILGGQLATSIDNGSAILITRAGIGGGA